jgi:hypothetical protein
LCLVYKLNKAKDKKDFDFILTTTAVSVLLYGVTAGWAMIA